MTKRNMVWMFIITIVFLFVSVPDSALASPQYKPQKASNDDNPQTKTTYYRNGKKKTEETYKNGLKHGKWREWYENGAKKSEYDFIEDKENGLCQDWYENGKPKSMMEFSNGVKNGKWFEWFESGKSSIKGRYTNDQESGVWMKWDESDHLLERTEYYESGPKKSEAVFEYDGSNVMQTINEWFENGTQKISGHLKNNRKHGAWQEWYENGNTALETEFKDGVEEGMHRDYYENGNNRLEAPMKGGKQHGICTFWNENGQKEWIQEFNQGTFVKRMKIYE